MEQASLPGRDRSSKLILLKLGETSVAVYHSLLGRPHRVDFETSEELVRFCRLVETGERIVTGNASLDELLSSTDESARRALSDWQIGYLASTRERINWFSLMTAETCNLGCSYCIAGRNMESASKARSKVMSIETARAGLDWYFGLIGSSGRSAYVNFSGGEPLANPETTLWAIEYSRARIEERELTLTINTNATLVTPEIAAALSRNRVAIATSLDGVPQGSDILRVTKGGVGASSKILRGWRYLLDAGCELDGFMATINGGNFDSLGTNVIDFALSWNFTWVRVSYDVINMPGIDPDAATTKLRDIYEYGAANGVTVEGYWSTPMANLAASSQRPTHASFFCGAVAGETISLHPDGRLSACGFSGGNLGNINRGPELDWDAHKMLVQSYVPGNRDFCRGCEIEGVCAGGCNITQELASTKSDDAVIRYNCDLYRSMTRDLLSRHFA